MKVICNRAALHEALGTVAAVIPTRTTKPVLQCLRMTADQDGLVLIATDLEVGIRYRLTEVEVSQGGEMLVPAAKLAAIVHELTDPTLTLESEEETLHVRGQGSHFRLYGFDVAEYPPVTDMEGPPDLVVDLDTLHRLVQRTSYAVARETTRYAINGVLWRASGKKLQFVATDGRRLAMASGALEGKAQQEVTVIAPAKAMAMIDRLGKNGDEKVAICLTENQMVLASSTVVLVSSLVEGHFPQYENVIPKDCPRRAKLQTDEFLSATRRAALLTDEESKGVTLQFSSEGLVMHSQVPEQGEATIETGVLEYEGDAMEIAFNPQYLIDALKVIDDETVNMELKEPANPAVLKAGSDFLYVIMPVTVRQPTMAKRA